MQAHRSMARHAYIEKEADREIDRWTFISLRHTQACVKSIDAFDTTHNTQVRRATPSDSRGRRAAHAGVGAGRTGAQRLRVVVARAVDERVQADAAADGVPVAATRQAGRLRTASERRASDRGGTLARLLVVEPEKAIRADIGVCTAQRECCQCTPKGS